jgi:hypothetical protein
LPLIIHAGEVSVQFFQRSVSLLLGQMRSNDRSGGERFDADGIVFGYRLAKQALDSDLLFRRKVLYAVRHHMPLSLLSQLSGAKFSGQEEGLLSYKG